MLQPAPTGYSAVVLPDGAVLVRTGLGAAAMLREQVPLRTGLTPYARTGDLPVITLAFLVVSLAAVRARRGPRPSA